jgi:hypothetical protein
MVLVVQNTAPRQDLGAATATVNLCRAIGNTIGVSLVGALFVQRLASQLTRQLPHQALERLGSAASITRNESRRCPRSSDPESPSRWPVPCRGCTAT